MAAKTLYFGSNPNLMLKTILKFTTTVFPVIAPRTSLRTSRKILINPFGPRNRTFKEITPSNEMKVDSYMGKVHLYHFSGGSKHILLCHGWADSSQSLESIIKSFLEQGYSVWAMDHIGHGKSDGKESHLFGYIDGLKNVIHFLEQEDVFLEGIIAHSMGGVALLNLEKSFLEKKKFVLMGAPYMFFESMFEKMNQMGIHQKILTNLLDFISKSYNLEWKALDPKSHKFKIDENFLIIHDKLDDFSPFEDFKNFVTGTKAKVFVTDNLGHRKILRDQEVRNKLTEFFNE